MSIPVCHGQDQILSLVDEDQDKVVTDGSRHISSNDSTSSSAPSRSVSLMVGSRSNTWMIRPLALPSLTCLFRSSQSSSSRTKKPISMLGSISRMCSRRRRRVWYVDSSSGLYGWLSSSPVDSARGVRQGRVWCGSR
ncbi:hypothetical protein H112_07308 [Trichophyton rubrum D6]|uniref:Uncharacterized protein n=3 Tax=Trichophyton TaxID=5550 RepID=A0A080WF87_TRIRC|nr:uncharacterized protein TERG_11869 [Trichophyton rubrum CBS 118892]EZF11786.1 hypothetical protein H100_07335 [Trichophyton rubrum MR850]EZF38503.1 hypothetical protein H102_07296 [Trichophyton rubrum CBS 100081]EZF49199.1 hypothetical protein H103_07319 [Trichophyton rubrum CBS 288.86]EZF59843.1 hypothetical protein H104_07271 [Trichophyton rubrum CBS 289.86]EZF70269.1 hypothetical protein H105_07334 [Trichophyton soudanense CBS 452.61]EZF81044.1 hypothetical protein H110_07317 [Trichophy